MKTRSVWTKGSGMLKMQGHPCIRNKTNMNELFPEMKAEYEHTLSSRHGEIWQNNEKTYKAIICSLLCQRRAREAGFYTGNSRFLQGSEMLITFPNNRLDDMVKLLGITRQPGRQANTANAFGKKE